MNKNSSMTEFMLFLGILLWVTFFFIFGMLAFFLPNGRGDLQIKELHHQIAIRDSVNIHNINIHKIDSMRIDSLIKHGR